LCVFTSRLVEVETDWGKRIVSATGEGTGEVYTGDFVSIIEITFIIVGDETRGGLNNEDVSGVTVGVAEFNDVIDVGDIGEDTGI